MRIQRKRGTLETFRMAGNDCSRSARGHATSWLRVPVGDFLQGAAAFSDTEG